MRTPPARVASHWWRRSLLGVAPLISSIAFSPAASRLADHVSFRAIIDHRTCHLHVTMRSGLGWLLLLLINSSHLDRHSRCHCPLAYGRRRL
jgi:hypothetical protein